MWQSEASMHDSLRALLPVLVAIVTPFLLTWIFTSVQAWRAVTAAAQAHNGEKRPPALPSTVPWLGHLISFILDGPGLFQDAARHFQRGVPVRLRLATLSTYVISGPELVGAVLRDTARGLRSPLHDINFLRPAYDYPKELLERLQQPEHAEAWKQRYHGLPLLLTGHWIEALAERFHKFASARVMADSATMGDDWVEVPDLCALVERLVTENATRAMFGSKIVDLNPNLIEDAREYNHQAKSLFMGLPAWTIKPAIRTRNRMRENLIRWQRQARAECDIDTISDDVAWEPWYGSKTFRTLQKTMTQQGMLDHSSRAAENLGALFGANGQPPYLSTWYLLETLHDPALTARVRDSIEAARLPRADSGADVESPAPLELDIVKLEGDTVLQAVYAETLRLHQAMVIYRFLRGDSYSLLGWLIGKDEAIAVPMRTAHEDTVFWNTGTSEDPHPLDRFWADRFIVRPDDPSSGPLREPRAKSASASREPYFSLNGCNSAWIPFGGGRGMCPGRHFAKRVIILTTAILLSMVRDPYPVAGFRSDPCASLNTARWDFPD